MDTPPFSVRETRGLCSERGRGTRRVPNSAIRFSELLGPPQIASANCLDLRKSPQRIAWTSANRFSELLGPPQIASANCLDLRKSLQRIAWTSANRFSELLGPPQIASANCLDLRKSLQRIAWTSANRFSELPGVTLCSRQSLLWVWPVFSVETIKKMQAGSIQ
jgi:hypothetical protein